LNSVLNTDQLIFYAPNIEGMVLFGRLHGFACPALPSFFKGGDLDIQFFAASGK
jgi:hypothetical protein